MTDHSKEQLVEIALRPSEMQRIALLVHQDLARVRGNIVMAEEKIQGRLPGKVRQRALETIRTGPEQRDVLEGAREAISEGLKQCRKKGYLK
jgi:hypothetical protein